MLGCAAFSAPSMKPLDLTMSGPFSGSVPCVTVASFNVPQPLDLSLPKWKVRQHWSGGSIVQENSGDANLSDPCTCGSEKQPSTHWIRPRIEIHINHNFLPSQPLILPGTQGSQGTPHTPQPLVLSGPQGALQVPQPLFAPSLQGGHPVKRLGPEDLKPPRKKSAHLQKIIGEKEHQRLALYVRSQVRKSTDEVEHVMEDDLKRLADTVHFLHNSGYYYGNLSWQDSIATLRGTEVGTFLIRDSSDPRFLFSLSVQTERGAASVRIHYSDGSFRLDADSRLSSQVPRFESVSAMIDYYVSQWKLIRDKGQVWLDGNGQTYSNVILRKPLLRKCHSLQHLCRLSLNRADAQQRIRATASATIPLPLQNYLSSYPFHN